MIPAQQSALLDRKFDMCFGHADQNKDGVVDAADILTFAARIIAAVGEPFGSPKSVTMLNVCQDWWHGLVTELDTNGDGKIDPTEYRVGMRKLVGSAESFNAASRPVANAIWSLCDRDDDGRVTATEFSAVQLAFGTSPENARIAFERLDLNSDGSLSVDELMVAFRDFYTSTDAETNGNWLFGAAFQTAAV
ncbi:EF-hand domain-containing protein [Streptomyces sp. NBC_01387]|uniref:EF-hand domain-containing protein n=1 Tax=unclassified Streptomyces TaxID=2593676 RepID=UPI002023DCD8|nr:MULTISPECIES: EF-hand domain-containing protein [unclassified Streptomyces]MCX4548072.1 EF-hand domain-containing protein [Streptomyces sp. NBC_01500]WSC19736.1 EF-hand domain-containing protein [Streptomyces sp. NBC_01766]WSV53760.1 EF-hand domain-containing protein [Streptomyces sp. NBC_01014]